jgi:hypothetical protein
VRRFLAELIDLILPMEQVTANWMEHVRNEQYGK